MKNLNSFNFVRKGLEFEEKRQAQILLAGGKIQQETRRYDEATGKTILMRTKEGAADYRYFPEPDLPPVTIDEEWIESVKATIPEMPDVRRQRYTKEYGLPEYDAMVLTLTKTMSDFFDQTVANGADAKLASNWLMGDVSAYLNSEKTTLEEIKLTPKNLAQMIQLIEDGTISSKIAKQLFKILAEEGGDATEIVEARGMVQLSDPAKLQPVIDEVIAKNESSLEDFRNGKDRAVGFFVGQVMKQTRGQANPQVVNKLLMATLNKLK